MQCRSCTILDDWHVIAENQALRLATVIETALLAQTLRIKSRPNGDPVVAAIDENQRLIVQLHDGIVWKTPANTQRYIGSILEAYEKDRLSVSGGATGVQVSEMRVVEKFLDSGQFAFIHDCRLGEKPDPEVRPNEVEVNDKGNVTECKFYQPLGSPTSIGSEMVDYEYKALRPSVVCFFKSNPNCSYRTEFIALFVQPTDPEHCSAHPSLCCIGDGMAAASLRWFIHLAFAQDKPILENQLPKRLPLDPRTETPVRADKVAINFRSWPQDHNVTYGAISAA